MKKTLATLVALMMTLLLTLPLASFGDMGPKKTTTPISTSVPSPSISPKPVSSPTPLVSVKPSPTVKPVIHRASRAKRTTIKRTVKPVRRVLRAVDAFDRMAKCESGGNPRALNPSGKYRGAFQFDLRTWREAGMTGDPINHSYATQKRAAKRLFAMAGAGRWPHCGKFLR